MSRLIEAAAREWRDPDYLSGGLDVSLLCLPLRRVIPADTRLRALYIDTQGTATLDLDSAFARGLSAGSADALLAVWSLVNTLAVSFAEVRQVKLLVEGEERRDLGGHLDLSRPLSADMSLLDGTRRNP